MDRKYTNQNLAGILCIALGLDDEGRASFSSSHRESLRSALEDGQPETFAGLLQALRRGGAAAATIGAVATLAKRHPERSLEEYAATWGKGEGVR